MNLASSPVGSIGGSGGGGSGPLNNFAATTDPGVGDDDADGYEVGSRWINITAQKVFECESAATGAAVWLQSAPVTGIQTELFRPPDGAVSGGSSLIKTAGASGVFDAVVYPNSGGPWFSWIWKTPKRCDQGQYRFRFFWSPTTTNVGTVVLGFYGQPFSDGDLTAVGGTNGGTVTDTSNGTIDDLHVTDWSSWINFSVFGTVNADVMLWLRAQRNAASGTFTGSVELYLIEMQWVSNAPNDN